MACSVAFALKLVPVGVLTGGHPIATLDYALHFARAAAVSSFVARCGAVHGYDPHFMAGYPTGTVFDVNNKGIELFVAALHGVGVAVPTAFNLFVFIAVVLPPVVMWAAARIFGLSPWEQVVVAGSVLALWILDREVSKTWRIGVIAFGTEMYCLPFSLACLYRYFGSRAPKWSLAFLGCSVVLSILHPLSFLSFYGPLIVWLLWRNIRERAVWIAFTIFSIVVLATNWFWIVPVVQQIGLKIESGRHWIGDLKALVRDVSAVRSSGLRLLVVVLGIAGLATWSRSGLKDRVPFLVVPVAALTLLGYVAGELPFFDEMELYRNNLVAAFLLTLPAAAFLCSIVFTGPHARVRVVVALAVVIFVMGLHFTARNPFEVIAGVRDDVPSYSLEPLGPDEMATLHWLKGNASPHQRVMIEFWPLGALTPWYTGLEVIGGPYQLVWLQHNFANYAALKYGGEGLRNVERMFGRNVEDFSPEELDRYLDAFNVGTVVAYTQESKHTFGRTEWLERVTDIGDFTIYRNTHDSRAVFAGMATVDAVEGGLDVSNASSGPLTLKYHWAPYLAAYPPQELVPRRVLDDPVPFIHLPSNRYPRFVIAQRGCDSMIHATSAATLDSSLPGSGSALK